MIYIFRFLHISHIIQHFSFSDLLLLVWQSRPIQITSNGIISFFFMTGWKLSSGYRTGKGQFSFQSLRKAMPKNAQTTAQVVSSHTLVKKCWKFSKAGFSNTWTVNTLMFKLVLEKGEEAEIKLPTSAASWKKQESSRRTSISALFTRPKPLTVWITINCGKFWKK